MARIDDISIQHLMQALWSDRRGGRVSVMVGAGFSRNADKITPDAKPLALWGDLRNLMLRELYPNKIPKSPPDALRLASMYEEAFHRSGLDAMLARELQDLSYQPGELHSLLLSLPWADVFTTNYDTLLERARQKVPDYRYELVLSPQDISTSHRPRIVKLHGSFPSQRPFIFTAEDYRRYPKENAAFVNLVQQAIIETTLCLIGFSGEDPNFLQWVGWVRDNLGASRPPIYLCGVLDLTPALERMYASMQVIPVDIGPLFPESEINDAGLRHQYATEWLLLKLHQGKPTDWINWPVPYSRPIPEPSYPQPLQVPPGLASRIIEDELPEAPDDQLFLRESPLWDLWNKKQQDASQGQQSLDTQAARETADLLLVPELRKLIRRWSAERRVYPGWMLCPHPNWNRNYYGGSGNVYLIHCMELIAYLLKKLKIEERLEALIEICWRYTCLMIPLPNCLVLVIEETLQAVNPFPRYLTHPAPDALTILRPDRPLPDEVKQLNWSSVSRQWVELVFVLLRDAWDDQNEEKFTLWSSRLEPVVGLRLEWKVQWCSESCQFFLARLDESRVRTVLSQWPELPGEPWWEAKKAAVLAELGDVVEALAIARKARGQIEGVRNIPFNDFRAPSQEAWIRYLEQSLEEASSFSRNASYDEGPRFRLQERVRELARFHCDPDRDLYYWEGKLAQGQTRPDRLPIRGFDDGDLRQPRTSSGFSVFAEWILVHFFRDAPLPIVAARHPLYPEAALPESARRLWRQNPKLAISLMVRCGFKDLDELIARHVLARIETTYAGDLFDWLSTALRQAMRALREMSPQQRLKEETLHHRIVERVPDIVSRFFCRLNDLALERALELATAFYNERPLLDERQHHTSAEVLLKRVMASAAPEQVLAWLPRLVRLPIPDWDGFSTGGRSFGNSHPRVAQWPDPVELVQFPDWFEPAIEMLPEPQKHELVENIRWLMQIVQSGSEQARRRALFRLEKLHRLNLLRDKELIEYRSAFRTQLQSDDSVKKAGLLVSIDLFPEESMREEGVAAEIKERLLQGPLGTYPEEQERYLRDIYQGTTMPWYEPVHNGWRIDWTPAEVVRLLEHLEAIAPVPGSPRSVGMGERVAIVLSDVVLLRLADASDPTRDRALRLLQVLGLQIRVPLRVLPVMLVTQSTSATAVANQLRVGIHSRNHTLIAEAAIGLERWLCLGCLGLVPAMPTFLVDDLVVLILSAHKRGLQTYIETMAALLRQDREFLTPTQLSSLAWGLEHLEKETRIEPKGGPIPPDTAQIIPQQDKPAIRLQLAVMARALEENLTVLNAELPPAIALWRSAALRDPLPEIRFVWPPEPQPA